MKYKFIGQINSLWKCYIRYIYYIYNIYNISLLHIWCNIIMNLTLCWNSWNQIVNLSLVNLFNSLNSPLKHLYLFLQVYLWVQHSEDQNEICLTMWGHLWKIQTFKTPLQLQRLFEGRDLVYQMQCKVVGNWSYHSGGSHFLAEAAMMMMRMVRIMAAATMR